MSSTQYAIIKRFTKMKDLKLKDLVLEHYRKVYEMKVDELTVRVWKPETMGKLPTHAMMTELKRRAYDAHHAHMMNSNLDPDYNTKKVQWATGNPDYGAWDAQLVRRFDPRQMTLDIYFAALLIRPFSQQAQRWYEAHSLVYDPMARLVLMWDSREFDRAHGYDTSYGEYSNQKEFDRFMYSGKRWDGGSEPINDPAFDPSGDALGTVEQGGFVLKYRHKDDKVETETSWPLKRELAEKVRKYLEPTLANFLSFTHDHPDVKEVHYYTEVTHWEADDETAGETAGTVTTEE